MDFDQLMAEARRNELSASHKKPKFDKSNVPKTTDKSARSAGKPPPVEAPKVIADWRPPIKVDSPRKRKAPDERSVAQFVERRRREQIDADASRRREQALRKEDLVRARIAAHGGRVTKRMAKQLHADPEQLQRFYAAGKPAAAAAAAPTAVKKRSAQLSKFMLQRLDNGVVDGALDAQRPRSPPRPPKPKQKAKASGQPARPDSCSTSSASTTQTRRPSASHAAQAAALKAHKEKTARKRAAAEALNFQQLLQLAAKQSERAKSSSSDTPKVPSPPPVKPAKLSAGKEVKRPTGKETQQVKRAHATSERAAERQQQVKPGHGGPKRQPPKKAVVIKPRVAATSARPTLPVKAARDGGPTPTKQSRPPDAARAVAARVLAADDSDSEYDSELDDFIDDSEPTGGEGRAASSELRRTLKELYRYDRRKFADEAPHDDRSMVSSYRQVAAEEARSAGLALLEDLNEYRKGSRTL